MNIQYKESADKAAAAAAAGGYVLDRLKSALEKRGSATFAVSGGSTPQILFEDLASRPFDWKNVHIFWVDERCVPPDHPESNYGMTRRALLDPLGITDEQVHRIQGELSPEEAAARYVTAVREFFRIENDSLPRFDLVHLGMGADAHTASLFPGEPLIGDRKQIAAAVYSAAHQSYRVTLLPGVLLKAVNTLFLVTGKNKAQTLRGVFGELYEPVERPVQLVARVGRNVRWFLDSAAADGIRHIATAGE